MKASWKDRYPDCYCKRKTKPEKILINFIKFLEKQGVVSGKVLDIGCGFGAEAIYLAKRGFKVKAIDINREAINFAKIKAKKANVLINFSCKDIIKYEKSLTKNSIDIIIDSAFIHSLRNLNRKAYIKNIKRIMKPKAWLYVLTFSDKDTICKNLCPRRNWTFRYKDFYCKFFKKKELKKILSGFELHLFKEVNIDKRSFYLIYARNK